MREKIFLSFLVMLGFQVNAAIESRLDDPLTFDDIHRGLDDGDLFERIEEKLPKTLDLSPYALENADDFAGYREAMLAALADAAGGMEGRESRKYGVKKSGLSLLMAYILEAIQQETHWVSGK